MTIKTQGGKLLTKGGKLACDCCGGDWVCCADRSCGGRDINSVTISITAEDYYFRCDSKTTQPANPFDYVSSGIRGSELSGTHTLLPTGPAVGATQTFQRKLPLFAGTECEAAIEVIVTSTYLYWGVQYSSIGYLANADAAERYRAIGALTCEGLSGKGYQQGHQRKVVYRYAYYALCNPIDESIFIPYSGEFVLYTLIGIIPGNISNVVETGSKTFSVNSIIFNR